MVRVKICGITRAEDALHAVSAGADALGFVFYKKSPRCLSPEAAREIISRLPPFVTAVGLFVNEKLERVAATASFCGLGALQFHGDEPPENSILPPWRAIKALRVKDRKSLQGMDRWPSTLLLDAWVPGEYGGTGSRFDWGLAEQVARNRDVILAGGLTPGNVAEAIRAVHPYAVDVSSGVESAPGIKDPEKVERFIRAAKAAGV